MLGGTAVARASVEPIQRIRPRGPVPVAVNTGPGLTDAGRTLVRRCAELGIAVDMSHLNEAGFWDVAKLDVGPLVASHSGAHALCETSRKLTDRQLDAIGQSGGLVGIVFACPFLRADLRRSGVHAGLAQLRQMVKDCLVAGAALRERWK